MAQKKLSKSLAVIIVLAVALTAAFLIWWFFIRQPPIPHNIVALSGRIGGDDSTVAAKNSGRTREIRARERDVVTAGDAISVLDEDEADGREDRARSAAQAADTRGTHAEDE